MKTMKQITVIAAVMLASFSLFAQSSEVKDTTLFFNQKKVEISDSLDQVKVKVYKMDTTEYKCVYEGIFSDEQTYERYSVESQLCIDIPFVKKSKKHMQDYYSDLRYGLVYLHNQFDFTRDGELQISRASELFWQPVVVFRSFEQARIAMITGLGLTWRNYHIGGNNHLAVVNGRVGCETAPEGINYYYSRLRTMEINLPLMFEWQPSALQGFHFSVGGLFGVNLFTSHKVKYHDPDTEKKIKEVLGKNYQINPFSFSGIIQAGYENVGVYCKYTPTSMFKKGKEPDVQTLSVGLSLSF